jgi:hypothetical protein
MSRPQKQPLRVLTEQEHAELSGLARSWHQPAAHVARARALLAVSRGASFTAAALGAGRKAGDGVAKLVSRFNAVGLVALAGRRPSGRAPTYAALQRERILAEVRRAPQPVPDGTTHWSLTTLQRALRQAPDGLPEVSTYPLWAVLRQAGYRFGRTRSWCPTGKARRKRKSGVVEVIDPDAAAKKN